MLRLLKRLVGLLPERYQAGIQRSYFARQIRLGHFESNDPEYILLDKLLSAGDWAIDIGANFGVYTLKMARLVGPQGHVFALEPVPYTFRLLAANCALGSLQNVTLLNVAASDDVGLATVEVPRQGTGRRLNYYQARLTSDRSGANCVAVYKVAIDRLELPTVRLVKIDVEGHEQSVIEGMLGLIERDHPVLIVESERGSALLESFGYISEHVSGTPNYLWQVPRPIV